MRTDTCAGNGEPGIAEGTDPLFACECDVSTVGTSISSCDGSCVAGTAPVVGVTGKTGVGGEMKDDGGSTGVLFPVSTGGTGAIPGSDCCGKGLRYVGLFIVLRGP